MRRSACCVVVLLLEIPALAQVAPSASGTPDLNDTTMMTPPMLGSQQYSPETGSNERSNHISGGFVFTPSYTDNVQQVESTQNVSDEIYSIVPTLSYDRRTPRQDQTLAYDLGYTFYQHTTSLNQITQSAQANYKAHLRKYLALTLSDSFSQNSNAYNQTNPYSSPGVPGSPPSTSGAVILPYQDQWTNHASAGLSDQIGKNAMIGASGTYGILNYANGSATSGLYNSNNFGASGFYNRRLNRSNYVGVNYQFERSVTHPISSTTVTNAILAFYSFFLTSKWSISVMGGPQQVSAEQPGFPNLTSWEPAVTATFGGQTPKTSMAVTYSKTVTGGQGLLGAYHSNYFAASGGWQINRNWRSGVWFGFSNDASLSGSQAAVYQGGTQLTGTATVQRVLTRTINAEAGYSRLHQDYEGVGNLSNSPDSNRVYGSISFQFTRPIGR